MTKGQLDLMLRLALVQSFAPGVAALSEGDGVDRRPPANTKQPQSSSQ